MNIANFAGYVSTHQWIIIPVIIWTLTWKGIALWKAARNNSLAWFIAMLVINTVGILEIIYIFAFSRKKVLPAEVNSTENDEKKTLDIKI